MSWSLCLKGLLCDWLLRVYRVLLSGVSLRSSELLSGSLSGDLVGQLTHRSLSWSELLRRRLHACLVGLAHLLRGRVRALRLWSHGQARLYRLAGHHLRSGCVIWLVQVSSKCR